MEKYYAESFFLKEVPKSKEHIALYGIHPWIFIGIS